jgi:hypothetical protein
MKTEMQQLIIDEVPNSGGYIVRDGERGPIYATNTLQGVIAFVRQFLEPPTAGSNEAQRPPKKAPAITIKYEMGAYVVCDQNDSRLYVTGMIEDAFNFIRKRFDL